MNCPYCNALIPYESVYRKWSNGDHLPEFHFECSLCDKTMQVDVQSVPEFTVDKLRCAKCQRVEIAHGYAYCDKCKAEIKAHMKK
jgi:transposase-like protein